MGVKLAFGSDEYYNTPGKTRGQASLLTLEAYQNDGLSPLEVLRTATVNAADLLGMANRIGTIEAGKLADIIAVDGDPLKDVRELAKVKFVMKGGRVIRNDSAPPR
jgi:imidazolonepropionase-like amidohydrolase